MARGLFPPGRAPLVNYTWKEWLEDNGVIVFNAGVMPGSTEKYEFFETAADSNEAISTTDWTAQTFTVGTLGTNEGFYVTKIRIDGDTSPGAIRAQIQETTAGVPNGTVLATFNDAPVLINSGATEWYEYDLSMIMSETAKLLASGVYALVLFGVGAASVGENTSGGYAGGSKYDSADTGGSWTIDTGRELLFQILGTPKNPYMLSSSSFTSSVAATTLRTSANANDYAALGNINFEGKINKAAIIEGNARVNFILTPGVDISNYYAVVELYHVRGAVETKIGDGETWSNAATTGIEMELTKTTVKSGDFIKLKFITFYQEASATATTTLKLSHDGTNLTLQLPFKTDL